MSHEDDLIIWDEPSMAPEAEVGRTACPVCFQSYPQSVLEEHVNACLNGELVPEVVNVDEMKYDGEDYAVVDPPMYSQENEEQDRLLALELLKQEEDDKKRKEEQDYRLLLDMLAEEKRNERQAPVESSYHCYICTINFKSISEVYLLESCSHFSCHPCLKGLIREKVTINRCSEIVCKNVDCAKPLLPNDIKELITVEEFETYEKATLKEVLDSSGSFIECANEQCDSVVERLAPGDEEHDKEEKGPDGKLLSSEAIRHRNENRFRCRECQTEFCSACRAVPYHLGFTCDSFESYQKARHCRFCGEQMLSKNVTRKRRSTKAGLVDICDAKECVQKKKICCGKTLSCGHFCPGVAKADCPPCLDPACVPEGASQNSEDYCNICWVEDLGSAPVLQLECGHFFHRDCTIKQIENKWNGSRITFSYLECSLCKKIMKNQQIEAAAKESMELLSTVKAKALERLKALEGNDKIEELEPGGKFYQNPEGYALYRFSYFQCFKCRKPYFGGEKVCEGNEGEQFNEEELVCGGCSDFEATAECKEHKTEYIEYKCRFCCNTSVWFCFGTTHFCDPCHKKAGTIQKVPKDKLPPCTCNIEHPPNGEEFLLGCSLCRLQKFNCY